LISSKNKKKNLKTKIKISARFLIDMCSNAMTAKIKITFENF
jgi:hypothetical protein